MNLSGWNKVSIPGTVARRTLLLAGLLAAMVLGGCDKLGGGGKAGWKWGGIASVMTLFLIIMVAALPSLASELAFLIAPLVAITISFNMITGGANTQP